MKYQHLARQANALRETASSLFLEKVYDKVGKEYTFLEEYVNNKVKLKVRHNICGNIYDVRPNDFLSRGRRCPKCSMKKRVKALNAEIPRKKNEDFLKEIESICQGEYTFLEEYVNNKVKLKVRHNICGNIYDVRPNDFLQGYRCPFCSSSRNSVRANLVSKFLKDNQIPHKVEFRLPKLSKLHRGKKGNFLRFDFYLPELKLIIEIDGQQHFIVRGNTYFNYDEKGRIYRDWIKNFHIMRISNLSLLRIPYNLSPTIILNILENLNDIPNLAEEFTLFYIDNASNKYNVREYYLKRNMKYFEKYLNQIKRAKQDYQIAVIKSRELLETP